MKNFIKEFTLESNRVGNLWNVFEYNGATGELKILNSLIAYVTSNGEGSIGN